MDLNLLPIFVKLASSTSFTATAAALGVRRSSVSRSISNLEAQLGVQLFSRTTRHVSLTTAGTALYAKIAPQMQALEHSLGTVPEREEEPSGEIRITAPNDLGAMILPSVIAAFTLRYPSIRIDMRLANRRVDIVGEGFDLALRVTLGRLSDSTLVARKVSDLDMVLFGAPTYLARRGTPKSADETKTHDWVQMRGMKLPTGFPNKAIEARVVTDDALFLYRAVCAGAGIGFLPTFLTREDVTAGRLVRILPRVTVRVGAAYLVHPPARQVPRKVLAFRDYLLEYFSAHPLTVRG